LKIPRSGFLGISIFKFFTKIINRRENRKMNLTLEEKEYILKILQTVTFNMGDCIALLNFYQEPDSKRDIVKDTLTRDLEYLMKLNDFIKMKLK